MKVRVLRSAVEDLAAGRRFYDGQERGVGNYFFAELFSDIDTLAHVAGVHRVQFGFHRMLAKRIPYAVYYRVIAGEAVVFRVFDCRRDPKWIRQSLQKT